MYICFHKQSDRNLLKYSECNEEHVLSHDLIFTVTVNQQMFLFLKNDFA